MGFLDELKKLTHPYDDDDDDFFGSASDDQPASEQEETKSERRASFFSTPEEAEPESYGIPAAPRAKPAFRIPRREQRRQADAADAAEAQAQRAGRVVADDAAYLAGIEGDGIGTHAVLRAACVDDLRGRSHHCHMGNLIGAAGSGKGQQG